MEQDLGKSTGAGDFDRRLDAALLYLFSDSELYDKVILPKFGDDIIACEDLIKDSQKLSFREFLGLFFE